jgi:hypothetical protein
MLCHFSLPATCTGAFARGSSLLFLALRKRLVAVPAGKRQYQPMIETFHVGLRHNCKHYGSNFKLDLVGHTRQP